MVQLDWGAPEEVLLNLTTNALHAMPQGGVLTIQTSTSGEAESESSDGVPPRWVKLRVTDTGRGMNAETLRRAFEPFFTTRSGSSGTGLGLAMVHRIVTRAGGRVSLQSKPGEGTAVVIELSVLEGSTAPKH
jgi:signal transduction histidine kinase